MYVAKNTAFFVDSPKMCCPISTAIPVLCPIQPYNLKKDPSSARDCMAISIGIKSFGCPHLLSIRACVFEDI